MVRKINKQQEIHRITQITNVLIKNYGLIKVENKSEEEDVFILKHPDYNIWVKVEELTFGLDIVYEVINDDFGYEAEKLTTKIEFTVDAVIGIVKTLN